MNIGDVLKKKGTEIFTVNKEDTICSALEKLNKKHIGALIVMDNETVAGILTERDILKKTYDKQGIIKGAKIYEFMTPAEKFINANKKNSIQEIMESMTKNKIRHMPIFEGEKLIGIVSIGDMVKMILELAETENEHLKAYFYGQ